jgi:hypothetical protein
MAAFDHDAIVANCGVVGYVVVELAAGVRPASEVVVARRRRKLEDSRGTRTP